MKNTVLLIFIGITSLSCYKQISLEGFDKEKWKSLDKECDTYRLDIAPYLIENQEALLKGTQNEIESLLGKATEHELYHRNQKFFHYRLTPPESCGNYESISYLSIRFNAIGRTNLVQIMMREPSS